jgi:GNAT superfamily N-acetyltransferase
MRVRPATIADAEECARVHSESSEAAYGRPRDRERTLENWRSSFEGDGASFVAEENEAIVGVLNVGPAHEETGVGELHLIYVLAESWGSGAGQLLIEQAHEALSARFDEAVLTVLASTRAPVASTSATAGRWTSCSQSLTLVASRRTSRATASASSHESGSADTESGSNQDRT